MVRSRNVLVDLSNQSDLTENRKKETRSFNLTSVRYESLNSNQAFKFECVMKFLLFFTHLHTQSRVLSSHPIDGVLECLKRN